MFRNTLQLNRASIIDFWRISKNRFFKIKIRDLKLFFIFGWDCSYREIFSGEKSNENLPNNGGSRKNSFSVFPSKYFPLVVSQRNSLNQKLKKVEKKRFVMFQNRLLQKSIILALLSWNVFLNMKKTFWIK